MRYKLVRVTTVPISLKVLLKGQHRYMASKGFEVIGVSSPGDSLEEVSEDEGVRTCAIMMTRKISPLKDLRSLWNFYLFCKKEHPMIIHSHTPKAGIIAMLGGKLAGVPIRMHTVAGLPLMEARGLKRGVLNFVEKLTYSFATGVYPNSFGLRDFILKNKLVRNDKVKVIANGSSNGIDTSYFNRSGFSSEQIQNLRETLNIGVSDFVFIFVGRLVGDKGLNELVEAFMRLSVKNVKLLLVGDPESDLDPLASYTIKNMLENDNIIHTGFQKDVRPYFAISDALVFPSYREGFPNVVLQAGALDLPSIVSDINGCNEIIVNEVNGLIVPVKNVLKLYEAMSRLIKDKSLFQQLKTNARDMILKRFEQIIVWESLLEEYNTILEKERF